MLIKELLEMLNDEAKGEKELSITDLWDSLKSNAKKYVSSKVFQVKYDESKKAYLVYSVENNRRKLYISLHKSEFEDTFEPIRPDDAQDAEGYLDYRLLETIEAAEYTGETTFVDIDGAKFKLESGDFVTRSVVGSDFAFAIEKQTAFKKAFIKA